MTSAEDLQAGQGLSQGDVRIPLYVQEQLFHYAFDQAVEQVRALLAEVTKSDELWKLALARLRQGYETFGSSMFTWEPERRRAEILEELADAVVYKVAGPIELSPPSSKVKT